MKKINVATVFSGIGAPEQALKKLGFKLNIIFACDNGEIEIKETAEEIKEKIKNMTNNKANKYVKDLYKKTKKTNYVKKSYFANYKISESNWYDDIRFLNGDKYKNKVDILIGGSPCQSFSIIGKRAGLEDTRGTLFYDYARLIQQVEPKVFIYENVPGMLTHDHGNTWDVIYSVFDSLGYKIYKDILNAKDYGIPQERKRLFVIGFRDKSINFEFPKPIKLEKTMNDYLEDEVEVRHYLGQKGFEFVTNPKYKNRARVNSQVIQTEKANQQFNWNGDFVFESIENINLKENSSEILKRAYVSNWNNMTGVIRQLSYRECLRLMGFPDSYKIVVPNVPAYRQAGNSIVVNVLEAILNEIIKVDKIYEED
jgi:DNA (cytosine-5)-methyltransferase 1